jgi:hypothetical protein
VGGSRVSGLKAQPTTCGGGRRAPGRVLPLPCAGRHKTDYLSALVLHANDLAVPRREGQREVTSRPVVRRNRSRLVEIIDKYAREPSANGQCVVPVSPVIVTTSCGLMPTH